MNKTESQVISKNEDLKEKNYNKSKNDPKYLKSLINKCVEIETIDGQTHIGKVYVVDPVSESVVTVTKAVEKCNVSIFLGHAIKSLKICDSKETENSVTLPHNITNINNSELLNEKKRKLKEWLTKNLVDVQEDGMTLKIGEDLIIEPPYDNEHCFSSNTIILQRIQGFINNMDI